MQTYIYRLGFVFVRWHLASESRYSAWWNSWEILLRVCSLGQHMQRVFVLTLSKTFTHTHTCCRAEGSVMDSPEHVCVVANSLRQGTWLTTAPKGAQHRRRASCSRTLAAPNLLSERKRHLAHFHPETVSVNYADFFQIALMLEFIWLHWLSTWVWQHVPCNQTQYQHQGSVCVGSDWKMHLRIYKKIHRERFGGMVLWVVYVMHVKCKRICVADVVLWELANP